MDDSQLDNEVKSVVGGLVKSGFEYCLGSVLIYLLALSLTTGKVFLAIAVCAFAVAAFAATASLSAVYHIKRDPEKVLDDPNNSSAMVAFFFIALLAPPGWALFLALEILTY